MHMGCAKKDCALDHKLLFPMQTFAQDLVVTFSWICLVVIDTVTMPYIVSKLFRDVHEALMVQVFCFLPKRFC